MATQNLQKYKEISLSGMKGSQRFGVICGGTVLMMLVLMLPFADIPAFTGSKIAGDLLRIGMILVAAAVATILHEGLHGLFFWRYTGKVKFGYRLWSKVGTVFYATSPNSILPKNRMMVVGIAPQFLTVLLLTLSGLVLLPNLARYVFQYMAAFNLGGGCFDLYFFFLLMAEKGKIFVEDIMTGMILYKG